MGYADSGTVSAFHYSFLPSCNGGISCLWFCQPHVPQYQTLKSSAGYVNTLQWTQGIGFKVSLSSIRERAFWPKLIFGPFDQQRIEPFRTWLNLHFQVSRAVSWFELLFCLHPILSLEIALASWVGRWNLLEWKAILFSWYVRSLCTPTATVFGFIAFFTCLTWANVAWAMIIELSSQRFLLRYIISAALISIQSRHSFVRNALWRFLQSTQSFLAFIRFISSGIQTLVPWFFVEWSVILALYPHLGSHECTAGRATETVMNALKFRSK